MSAGRKLGYAAAIAGGLLLATAWAVAAQSPCVPSFTSGRGLTFSNCDDPDQPIAQPSAVTACENLYTVGYWSDPSRAAGQHRDDEADRIRDGLRNGRWSGGTVGAIQWKFEADTETVDTPWGYEDPATITQTIATLTALVDNVQAALHVSGADLGMSYVRAQAEAALDILDDLQAGGHQVPYYVDLPYWVDHIGKKPASFDPNVPTYQDHLKPRPEHLAADVGHFLDTPDWNPTLRPGLEILKCDGWSATPLTGTATKYDNTGIYCSPVGGWTHTGRNYNTGECTYTEWIPGHRKPYWPFEWVPGYDADRSQNWTCKTLPQEIEVGTPPNEDTASRTLSGDNRRNPSTGRYSCRYRYPLRSVNNFSSQLGGFGVNLAGSSKPANTVGTDIRTDTSTRPTTPTGWAVRWVEVAAPDWPPGCDGFKPCWATFTPDVRMSPRLDQLLVGTPTWVWMDNVRVSCLPNALPPPPGPPVVPVQDCDLSQYGLWQAWPTDETDPNIWRHTQHTVEAGTIWRAVFPQKISIELTPVGGGATSTYECWTDDKDEHGVPRPVADGAWAPGRRPTLDAGSMPLATPNGPLNPGAGDCTFVHTTAGEHTATITIHWIGKEGYTSPQGTNLWLDPPAGEEPGVTVQTSVTVVFHELHVIPGS